MARRDITVDRVRELLHYDQESGEFSRIKSLSGRWGRIGPVTKSYDREGYQIIGIDGSRHFAHRLAWLYVNGDLGDMVIDHINGVRTDNRICNLRLVKRELNNQLTSAISSKSGTGYTGVYKVGRKFRIHASIKGVSHVIGGFVTALEAHQLLVRLKTESYGVSPRL